MDVCTLDLSFQNTPHAVAAYLVVGPQGPVLVETGPGSTLATLKAQLADHGYYPGDIRHVLVSHIHLDHAGAAGWWAQQGAQVYVHHVGARHLIDPSRLLASATRIYGDGDEMDKLWGQMLPAPAAKVTPVYDGDILKVGGLTFTALDAPGHARHHHVYRLGDIAFTGDAAGISLPQTTLVDLPAPPPEFDLEIWSQTIDRLLKENFAVIYLSHFGLAANVCDHLESLKELVYKAAEFVLEHMKSGAARDELVELYTVWNRERAVESGISKDVIHQYETANPLDMSVDGIMRYWRKRFQ